MKERLDQNEYTGTKMEEKQTNKKTKTNLTFSVSKQNAIILTTTTIVIILAKCCASGPECGSSKNRNNGECCFNDAIWFQYRVQLDVVLWTSLD